MEKVIVIGCACVVVSSLTPEEIRRFERFDPGATVLEKEDGTTFSIRVDEGSGSLMEDVATYSLTATAEGKATITILIEPEVEDKAALVKKKLGAALLKLDELEKRMQEKKGALAEMENMAGELITQL